MQPLADRSEPDGWTTEGEKITSVENLARIRTVADECGAIIVRHAFLRGSCGPDILGFTNFEKFEEYLARHATPGDAFDVWSFCDVCTDDRIVATGKLPDADGAVPRGGAY